jgi:hypothetical protein
MGADLHCSQHSLTKAFFDRQRTQFFRGEFDQPFTELLQFELLSFLRGFAGL